MEIAFDDDSDEPALKEMSNPLVSPIRVLSKASLELLHEFRNVPVRCQHNKVKVIAHERARQNLHSVFHPCFDEDP